MEKKFANGLIYSLPTQNAPAFKKAILSFKTEEFKKFLDENTNERGYVNVDILESRDGNKLYGVLNEWKKPDVLEKKEEEKEEIQYPEEEINPEDIPF